MNESKISKELYNELTQRGLRYLRVLNIPNVDMPDCLGQAWEKVVKFHNNTGGSFPEIAQNFWRQAVFQAGMDFFRALKISPYETDYRDDEILDTFHGIFPELTEEEIKLLSVYLDNNLNIRKTSQELHIDHKTFSKRFKIVQEKIRNIFPEKIHKPKRAEFSQAYINKSDKWGQFLNGVEVVDYRGFYSWQYQPED